MPASLQQSARAGYFSSWRLVITRGGGSRGGGQASAYELGHTQGHYPGAPHDGMRYRNDPERMVSDLGSQDSQQAIRLPSAAHNRRRLQPHGSGSGVHPRRALTLDLSRWGAPRAGPAGARQAHAHASSRRLHYGVGSRGVPAHGEVSNLQICKCKFGHDAACSPIYQGTMALRVYKRKQSQVRKGLYPRIGRAVTVASKPTSRTSVRRCLTSAPRIALRVAKAVINSLKLLDVDTKHFSGISMRRVGISAGLVARVPEPILFFRVVTAPIARPGTTWSRATRGCSSRHTTPSGFNGQGQQT
jgi:hypothetical protein